MKQLRCDSIGWVRISPSKRSGSLIVGFDVAHEFATQVGHGCEEAAGDDVALDLGEPVFDLVEPGRATRPHRSSHYFEKAPPWEEAERLADSRHKERRAAQAR